MLNFPVLFFRIYMRQLPGVDASPSPGTTIVVEPITINVENQSREANPFDVRQIHFSSNESSLPF